MVKSHRVLLASAVALVAALASGMASGSPIVVYDSSSAYVANTPNPDATSGYNDNITTHDTEAYEANSHVEVGGEIGLAGTARLADSATVQFRTGPNGSAAISAAIPFTLNFYADDAGAIGALLGSVTTTVVTPAGTGNTRATQRPFFDVTFDLTGLALSLPSSVFYGVSIDPDLNTTAQSLNISLWNYGTQPGFGPTDADYDGPTIKTGTDLSNEVWYRQIDGSLGSYAGFTPNLILTADQPASVPEPGGMALGGIGLVAVALARRAGPKFRARAG